MKQYLKRLLEIIAVGILAVAVAFISCNSQTLTNRIKNYESRSFQPDDTMSFR